MLGRHPLCDIKTIGDVFGSGFYILHVDNIMYTM